MAKLRKCLGNLRQGVRIEPVALKVESGNNEGSDRFLAVGKLYQLLALQMVKAVRQGLRIEDPVLPYPVLLVFGKKTFRPLKRTATTSR